MGCSVMGWAHEWPPHLKEVLEVAVKVGGASWSLSLGIVLPDCITEDLNPSVVWDLLAGLEILILLSNSIMEVLGEPILKGLFSLLSDLGILSQLLDSLVVGFVEHELERMLVVGNELVLSVQLINQSSVTTVLDQVYRCLGYDWSSE